MVGDIGLIVHSPNLVELLGEFDKVGKGSGCRVDGHDFIIERAGEVLSKGIYFRCVVCIGAIGMDDPILVPFYEWAVVHL